MRNILAAFPIISLLWSIDVSGAELAGPYLAARQASNFGDFEASARYNSRLIVRDRTNRLAMEDLVIAYVAMGRMNSAINIIEAFQGVRSGSYFIHTIALTKSIYDENFDTALEYLQSEEADRSFLLTALTKAWVLAGKGETEAAISQFDQLEEDKSLTSFAVYHKALLYFSKGDYAFAEVTLKNYFDNGGTATNRILVLLIKALINLKKFEEANDYFIASFGKKTPVQFRDISRAIKEQKSLEQPLIKDARTGVGEVFLTIAQILNAEKSDENTLVFARVAEFLLQDSPEATLLCADILSNFEQYDLAVQAYAKIPLNSALFHTAEIGRAEALSHAGNREEAINVLRNLTQVRPNSVVAFQELGNELRYLERHQEAAQAYTRALAISEDQKMENWLLHYSRGMSFERLDDWENAEADFRAALELQPNQPYVLNYLGYSLVEKKMKLDEALEMIKQAVSLRSESGYIVDSYGWVLFRLKRYDEAVLQLERAAELMPIDPIINDHLGDGYWAVGRKREAMFQWRRALSFDPDEKEEIRIKKKLDVGLDQLLIEEGNDPLFGNKSP